MNPTRSQKRRRRRMHLKDISPRFHHINQNREEVGSLRIQKKIFSKEKRSGGRGRPSRHQVITTIGLPLRHPVITTIGLPLHHPIITTIGYPFHHQVITTIGYQHSIPVGITRVLIRPQHMVETIEFHHSSLMSIARLILLQHGSLITHLPLPIIITIISNIRSIISSTDMLLHPQGMVQLTAMAIFQETMIGGSVYLYGEIRRSSSKSILYLLVIAFPIPLVFVQSLISYPYFNCSDFSFCYLFLI